jgi:hypothetical protein
MSPAEIKLTMWEQLLFLRIRAELSMKGRRFSAEPFSLWASACPACGGSYAAHQATAIGGAPAPGLAFISALNNHQWDQMYPDRSPGETMGRRDWVLAFVLDCPVASRLIVFVCLDPFGLRLPALISQEILTDAFADGLRPYLREWRPAIRDRLQSVVQSRRDRRARYRALPASAKLERILYGSDWRAEAHMEHKWRDRALRLLGLRLFPLLALAAFWLFLSRSGEALR